VVLSSLVDGVILVVGSGMVQRDQLTHTLEALESVAGRVLGLVLNRLPSNSASAYGSYGTYAYAAPEGEATRRERKRVEQA
jgi:Mrp family chromosome partitioning ATPase